MVYLDFLDIFTFLHEHFQQYVHFDVMTLISEMVHPNLMKVGQTRVVYRMLASK